MKVSLFGKNLFEVKKSTSELIFNTAIDKLKKSDFLIDFHNDTGGSSWDSGSLSEYVVMDTPNGGMIAMPKGKKGAKKAPKPEIKVTLTPKGVYELKLLNDVTFAMKADPAYVDEQIATFKDKLDMIKTKEFDMNRGTNEIGSMLSRLENRKKYAEHESFYSEFPYTYTAKINEVIKAHDNLKMGEISQFIADMPKEAVETMKRYTEQTKKLCDKKPVYYIIADKKDFKKTDKRRDPILLAQSPFGHFWQILGAWDEEMLFLDEL